MKKAVVWPLIILMVCLVFGAVPAQAESVSVVFSGPDKLKAGGTYTYTYEIRVNSAAVAYTTPVTAGGAFELVSGGEGLMYDTIPDNTSGSSAQGTIEVRVKAGAKSGDKAILSASGEYAVLDENYNQTEHTFQGSFQASVTSGSAPSKTPAATPTAVPSTTPDLTPTLTSEDTSAQTPAATVDTTAPAMTNMPAATPELAAAVTTGQSGPPNDDAEAASAKAGSTSVWLIAAIIAVFVLAAGLLIALYMRRRTRPVKRKSAVNTTGDYMNSRRHSSYNRRGRHRR